MACQTSNMEFKVDMPAAEGNSAKCLQPKGTIKAMQETCISSLLKIWKVGKDDPRKIAHALKVGLALSVVSLVYLTEPLFEGVGDSAIWAIMTVVVVFEFTAGATLSKGLNRACGTLLAGGLALFAGYLADCTGEVGEAVLIGVIVFILGTVATYVRFFPKIKCKYDYGVLIFLLTFNMITISGYRQEKIYVMAYKRLITITIGCTICLLISLLIFPIWAGDDLHSSIINNFECFVKSFEECIEEYLQSSESASNRKKKAELDTVYEKYKKILDSKTSEELMATYAWWEPRHGKFKMRYPWKQYVEIGANLRQCAYSAVAVHGCLHSEFRAPESSIRVMFKTECLNISKQVVEVMKELSSSIRRMRRCRSNESMIPQLHLSVQSLLEAFSAQPEIFVDSSMWHISEEILQEDRKDETSQEVAGTEYSLAARVQDIKSYKSFAEDAATARRFKKFLSLQKTNCITKCNSFSSRLHSIEFDGVLGAAAFASLLMELAARLEHVVVSVEQLGKLAGFKEAAADDVHTENNMDSVWCCFKGRRRLHIIEPHIASQNVE